MKTCMCKEEEGREESELLVYIAEHRNPFMECFFCFGLFEDENSKYNISHRHLNVALAFGLMHFAGQNISSEISKSHGISYTFIATASFKIPQIV